MNNRNEVFDALQKSLNQQEFAPPKGGMFFSGPKCSWFEPRRFLMLLLITLVLSLLPAQSYAAPLTGPTCNELPHHILNQYTQRMLNNPNAYVWGNLRTGDVFVAMRIAECGNRWFISIWRGWRWRTNFFPKWGQSLGFAWSYIVRNVIRAGASWISWNEISLPSIFMIIPIPCNRLSRITGCGVGSTS